MISSDEDYEVLHEEFQRLCNQLLCYIGSHDLFMVQIQLINILSLLAFYVHDLGLDDKKELYKNLREFYENDVNLLKLNRHYKNLEEHGIKEKNPFLDEKRKSFAAKRYELLAPIAEAFSDAAKNYIREEK